VSLPACIGASPIPVLKWHCIQLGSREHYAIPRMLQRADLLGSLITDAWAPPASLAARCLGGRMSGRYSDELHNANVQAPIGRRVLFEGLAQLRRLRGWNRIVARNAWFQRYAVQQLAALSRRPETSRSVVFSYSYTAREPFRWAKSHGWKTVLGQIDPGPREQQVVLRDSAQYRALATAEIEPPAVYWEAWRDEVELADVLLVNSEWSRTLLCQAGVADDKIRLVPLALESSSRGSAVREPRPKEFDDSRPLRVLFLGQVNLRKGVGQLFDAIDVLADAPVQFRFVGPLSVNPPESVRRNPKVEMFPSVGRELTPDCYSWADIFILPTLSDGFAITQLEAQAAGVPVIASLRCGEVVVPEVNGILLDKVTPDAIVRALRRCLAEPGLVSRLAAKSEVDQRFSLSSVQRKLEAVAEELS
jgi:glycosyltransferase involved in cell wall biosynthesis